MVRKMREDILGSRSGTVSERSVPIHTCMYVHVGQV